MLVITVMIIAVEAATKIVVVEVVLQYVVYVEQYRKVMDAVIQQQIQQK